MKEERKKETSFLLGLLSRSWKKVDKETACVCEQGTLGCVGPVALIILRGCRKGGRRESMHGPPLWLKLNGQ